MKKVKRLLAFCFCAIYDTYCTLDTYKSCSRTICGRLCSPPPLFLTRIVSLTSPLSCNGT